MYKFIKETSDNKVEYVVKNDDICWPELLEQFFWFLEACSFCFSAYPEEMVDSAVLENELRRKKNDGKRKKK